MRIAARQAEGSSSGDGSISGSDGGEEQQGGSSSAGPQGEQQQQQQESGSTSSDSSSSSGECLLSLTDSSAQASASSGLTATVARPRTVPLNAKLWALLHILSPSQDRHEDLSRSTVIVAYN